MGKNPKRAVQDQRVINLPPPKAKRPGGVTGKGFRPGQSGNPSGRPKGQSVTACIRELLKQTKLDSYRLPAGKRVMDVVAEVILKAALRGEHRYVETLLDRVEGRATLPIAAEGDVTIKVEYVNDWRGHDEPQVQLSKSEQSDRERAFRVPSGNRGVRTEGTVLPRGSEPPESASGLGEEDSDDWV
jgi:hypothetical protein